MIEPSTKVTDLTVFQLQTIVRKVQEALWKDGPTGEWILPEVADTSAGETLAMVEAIDAILTDYELAPVETEDEPTEPEEGDLTTEDHIRFWSISTATEPRWSSSPRATTGEPTSRRTWTRSSFGPMSGTAQTMAIGCS